ncbi:UPC2-regulatory involved in control of sterol uptake [Fusarium agapanthi]|uniref:UPC2-regulatory involved in control of sterol uptake n=1 Tax=Fusarium agapanthi TaxID=1803897 RepID=A0A9P5B522_9HYPO|nr:UPC2-regulatory involved in control of sterol uptake [Fusarium agapanthi]
MDLNQEFTPGMLSFTDQPDFDYAAFLQTDDITFGEGAQIQQQVPSDSSDKATPPSTTSGSSSELVARPSAQKQRLERRGHTKSRRGCYNCKRRRIKCQETRPACGHCTKTALKCEYPSMPQITHQPHHQIPLFSLQDMRFFQHFLTQCYPHHPLKQEDIWTHEIPCIAHNHEYLMHAILGFSASELMRNDSSIVSSAMNHRIKAIRAIKKRLAKTARSSMEYEEANAMVATCYALTFQSVSLDDGLAEYLTFIRGIMIVAIQMLFRGIKPIFENMMEPDQDALLEPLMQGLPLIPKGYTDSAMEALTNLKPLCAQPVEVEYHQHLVKMGEKLYINSWDAYKAYTAQYGWWMLLPHDTFQALIDSDNQVMMLLHSHWVAINEIMSPISGQERNVSEKYPPERDDQPQLDPGFARWLKHINANIDLEHQIYNQWPMWVEEQLDQDITFFGRT